MTVDTKMLGETAAKCMDGLESETEGVEGELVAVGIVAIYELGDDETRTRIFCSHERHFEHLGIFRAALECVEYGTESTGDDDD